MACRHGTPNSRPCTKCDERGFDSEFWQARYTTIDAALEAVNMAAEDICADNMTEIEMGMLSETDVAHTALQSVLPECSAKVASELRRRVG